MHEESIVFITPIFDDFIHLYAAPVTLHPTVLKFWSCQLSTNNFNTLGISTTSPLQDFSLVA